MSGDLSDTSKTNLENKMPISMVQETFRAFTRSV